MQELAVSLVLLTQPEPNSSMYFRYAQTC